MKRPRTERKLELTTETKVADFDGSESALKFKFALKKVRYVLRKIFKIVNVTSATEEESEK